MSNWHGEPVDQNGNVACFICHQKQSPTFTACIYCCSHNQLSFDKDCEDWDEMEGKEIVRLTVECDICGKNFGFSNEILIKDYKVIRVTVDVPQFPQFGVNRE